jgi:hypothetical protein
MMNGVFLLLFDSPIALEEFAKGIAYALGKN